MTSFILKTELKLDLIFSKDDIGMEIYIFLLKMSLDMSKNINWLRFTWVINLILCFNGLHYARVQ